MHELGLCIGIVDAVQRRAGGRPVARVRVRVGCLHHVHPDAFAQSFAVAAMGTVADGAEAELVEVVALAACRGCGNRFETVAAVPACPRCGSVDLHVTGGDELTLELIEYRAAGDAGPAFNREPR